MNEEHQHLKLAFAELEVKYQATQDEVNVLMKQLSILAIELAAAKNADKQLFLSKEIKRLHEALKDRSRDLYGVTKDEGRPHKRSEEEAAADRLEEEAKEAEAKKKRKKARRGPTKQPSLPVTDVHHHLDEADQMCPCCGTSMALMGGDAVDTTELIVAVSRQFKIERHIQHKSRCPSCQHIDTALGPDTRLVKGGRYDLSFVVMVALDKYLDHLPLERQVRRMRRDGLIITSQTLWDQLVVLYGLLLPTLVALETRVRHAEVLHADETSWRMMGKGRTKKWWLWVLTGLQGAFFQLLPSRGKDSALSLLQDFDGVLVADGYAVYRALEQARDKDAQGRMLVDEALPNYRLAGCWSHARRPFVKAEKHGVDVAEGLDLIAELFHIEALAKERAKGDEDALLRERKTLRETRSHAVIDKLNVWRKQQITLPKSEHAKGLTYLENQWKPLTLFLSDPRVPIENNTAERRIRGPVVSRKNYQGVRSVKGAQVAAMLFSFFATCEIVGVDPRAWLLAAVKAARETPTRVLLPHDFVTASAES